LFEKYQNLFRSPQPPLQRGAKFLKVPLCKGDLGGYQDFGYMTKDFSSILLDKTILVMSAISQIPHLFNQWEISTCKNNHQ
jgi:hypothetical protein